MQAASLVSLEEYLSTSYDPDCDYVDGAVLERNVGEIELPLTEVFPDLQ